MTTPHFTGSSSDQAGFLRSHSYSSAIQQLVQNWSLNPDLWLALELEERVHGSGIWWNSRKGYEALRMSNVEDARIVEIRTDHLLKYLQSRQLSLVIGH